VFERFVKPNARREATDASRVEELHAQALLPLLDYLESQLPADHGTVLARFSIADAALGMRRLFISPEPAFARLQGGQPAHA